MLQPSHLHDVLQQAIADRARGGLAVHCLDEPLPSSAPDFFSNDYLGFSADSTLRDAFLSKVQAACQTRLLGSTGSRLGTGNSAESNALEDAFKRFFGSPSALLCHSGFNANLAFFATIPRESDVVICDELIHSSCREGIRLSSSASYRFDHNSVTSFKECLLGVLQRHPQITRGNSTVFVVVESLYSMNGDFCPLMAIVALVEALVPAGHAHIYMDEAHTSGLCGPNGTGYAAHLGLSDRVHTRVHTLGKAWGFHRAVMLTSPIVRNYLINCAKSIMYSTQMPYTDVYALQACLDVMSSTRSQELRQRLNRLCRYARKRLCTSLENIPETILTLNTSDAPDPGLFSQIVPVFTPFPASLADHLMEKGYAVSPLTYPVVKVPRIRVIVHAGNTEAEIDALVGEILGWAERQAATRDVGKALGVEARARL